MSKTLVLQNDAQVVIKVTATDGIGAPIAVPADSTATSSDTAMFNSSINADGNVLVVAVPNAIGSGTLTYTNGKMSDEVTVNVVAPAAAAVQLDVDHAIISAQSPQTTATPASTLAPAPSVV